MSYVIEDGYTENGYIAERPGIHGAVRFKYRPMTHRERYLANASVATGKPAELSKKICDQVAKYLCEWDIPASDGTTLPISSETVPMLKPSLVERLYSVVYGTDGGDLDPDAKPDSTEADMAFQALMEDKPVAVLREEADAKN